MGIEFGKNDFEDDSIVLGADRDHAIDYPDPVASRAEQAFMDSLPREKRRQRFHSLRERPEENEYTISGMGNLVADLTPVIGEIKAAYELPNDLSYAFELVERGYEERDLKKMGLGGAFATLSAMGIIPGVRIGAKAGKESIKASIKAPEGLDIKATKAQAQTLTQAEKDALSSAFDDLAEQPIPSTATKMDDFRISPETQQSILDIAKKQNNEVTFSQIQDFQIEEFGAMGNIEFNEITDFLAAKNIQFAGDKTIKDTLVDNAPSSAPSGTKNATPVQLKKAGDSLAQLAQNQDNKVSQYQVSQALNKNVPVHTSQDVEDLFMDLSVKNINVVDDMKIDVNQLLDEKLSVIAKEQDGIVSKQQVQDFIMDDVVGMGISKNANEVLGLADKYMIQNNIAVVGKLNNEALDKIYNNIGDISKSSDEIKKAEASFAIKDLANMQNNTVSVDQLQTILKEKDVDFPTADSLQKFTSSNQLKNLKFVDKVKQEDITPITGTIALPDDVVKALGEQDATMKAIKDKQKSERVGGTARPIDVDMTADQKYLLNLIQQSKKELATIALNDPKLFRTLSQTIPYKGKVYDLANRADQIELAKMLPKSLRRKMIQEMTRPVPRIFHGSRSIGDVKSGELVGELIEQRGFEPFADFKGATGIGGSKASGTHLELGKKMLSTSRDPLVSMKSAFGDLRLSQVVTAPFPKSEVRPMKPAEYDAMRVKAQYSVDDAPVSLPRTGHKEAEIAFSRPEDITDVTVLDKLSTDPVEGAMTTDELKDLGKKPLKERVRVGQKLALNVAEMIKELPKVKEGKNIGFGVGNEGQKMLSASDSLKAYDRVKNIMKRMQQLGQFTEQYGARGTYDSFIQTLRQDSKLDTMRFIENNLEGERKEQLGNLVRVLKEMGSTRQGSGNTGITRKVSDKKLNQILKDKESLTGLTYNDLKRLSFLVTDKLNRGGLMAKR